MAKNERNYIPKSVSFQPIQYNGTQTTTVAPMPLIVAGAEGAKIYALKLNFISGAANSINKVYFSKDGAAPFKEIYSFTLNATLSITKKLFVDFWDTAFVTDADGNKYINVEAGGGFFVDLGQNDATVDTEPYAEDY